ncbi:MAG TPA: isovaleryl-CoA dehydrogenase [Bryobacteraceae bacterium]|nr:isovaleryl-CoA dehydrogenase [Bryobacteraceae bacterium]
MEETALNQPRPLADYNLFSTDRALREAVAREGAGWACAQLEEFGRAVGTAEAIEWGRLANEYPPVLRTHDRYGNRRDEVEFHPAWHRLMRLAVEHGIHCLPWAQSRPGAHVARGALAMLASQNEAGHVCPISMTYAAAPVLRHDDTVARDWIPRICSTRYDPSFRPAPHKDGALVGMAMTEKQGGSDVRANTTRAEPIGDREYLLDGHKWFCSAPMCDAFLVLAQAPRGLSCFLLPRWTPDERRNAFHLQRLKPKLGNRSNASSEVEFHRAWARMIGEEGRGVATIIEMVHHTRLDCAIASAALMRRALVEAVHHARHRHAFGKALIGQPLMRNVLADLAIESEAATLLAMRLAGAFDQDDRAFARLAVAAGKYWLSKRTPPHVAEALECLGGNGYVEESLLPRLYREAPLNSIWEGSGNVIALDVLRAVAREPDALERVLAEIRLANDPRIGKFLGEAGAPLGREENESGARRFSERLALALQASLLVRFSPPAIADAFCASRLAGDWGRAFGTLPSAADFGAVITHTTE